MKNLYDGLCVGLLRPIDHLHKVLVFALFAIGLTLISTMSLCFETQYAYADVQSNSPLSISLNTNQGKYEKDDIAEISLAVLNNFQDTHLDVKRDVILPEGLELIDTEEISKQHGNLDPQNSINELIHVKLANSDSASASALADTGDNQFLFILFIVALVSFAVFMLVKRRSKHLMSAVLVVVIAMSGVSLPAIAMADEAAKDIQASETIDLNFDGAVYAVGVAISAKVKSSVSNPNDTNKGETTPRGQWIAELLKAANIEIQNDIEDCPYADIAGNKYENEIKTAWAQGVLDGIVDENTKQFLPNQSATKEFSLATTVLALGFNDDGSEYKGVDSKDCSYPSLTQIGLDLEFMSLDGTGCFYPKQNLTNTNKQDLLKAIEAYLNQGPLSEETNIVYRDDVTVISAYSKDSNGMYVFDREEYPVVEGSKVAFESNDANPKGSAGYVKRISQVKNNLQVEMKQAESLDEIFESISIHDEAGLTDCSQIEFADGVTVVDDIMPFALNETDIGTLKLKIPLDNAPMSDSEVQLKFTPRVRASLGWDGWKGFSHLDLALISNLDIEVSGTLKEKKIEKHLFKKPVPIYMKGGLFVGIMPVLKVSASGSVSIECNFTNESGVVIDKKHIGAYGDTATDLQAKLEGKASASISPFLFGEVFSIEIVDVQLDMGIQGTADATLRPTGMICENIKAHPFVTLTCGKNTLWMENHGLSFEKKLLTEKNCPKKQRLKVHFENEKLVPECTWDTDNEFRDPELGKGDGGEGGIPAPDDNGFSDIPVLEDISGSMQYCNKLVQPFNVNAGKTVTIGAPGETGVAIAFDCDPGTIYRLTEKTWNGEVESSDLKAFVSAVRPWHGDTIYVLEVLCGRVIVKDITAWNPPTTVLGKCDTVSYPFSLSDSAVTMKVNGVYDLSYTNSLNNVFGDLYDDRKVTWESSNPEIVKVGEDGHLEALQMGDATITASLGGDYGFKRQCDIKVERTTFELM